MKHKILFSDSHRFIYKNFYLIILLIVLEYVQLFDESIKAINIIANEGQETNFINALNYVNPFYILNKYQTCMKEGEYSICIFDKFLIAFIFVIFLSLKLIFYLYIKIKRAKQDFYEVDSRKRKRNFREIICLMAGIFYANYFDLLFHLCSYSFIYFLMNIIVQSVFKLILFPFTEIISDFVIFLFALLIFFYFLYLSIYYIQNFSLIIQFDRKVSLHYDNIFSGNYDTFLLFYKIMIAIFKNFSFVKERNFSLFLNISIAFLPSIFVMVLCFKLYKDQILFLINTKFNATRIFLLIFNSGFMIFFLIFNKELNNLSSMIINFISVFCLSIHLTYYLVAINRKKILGRKNLIYQLAYIISAKNFGQSNLKSDIYELILFHKMNCEKNFLQSGRIFFNVRNENMTCSICNIDSYTYDTFLKNYFEICKISIYQQKHSQMEFEIFALLKLFILNYFEPNRKIQLLMNVVKISKSKNKMNEHFFTNVILFYDYFNEKNKSIDVRIYNILQIYEETSTHLEKILNLTVSIYNNLEIRHDFHSKAEEIFCLRNKIKENFLNFSKYKDIRFDDYSLATFKKVYEILFNTTIEEFMQNIQTNESKQIILNHFEIDQFIQINFDLNQEILAVVNVSKHLNYMKNKNLEEFFPKEISKELKLRFMELLKKNETDSFTFEFPTKLESSHFLIKNVILKCEIYHSFDLSELKIFGTYEIKENNLILLENDGENLNSAVFINCSENIAKLLYLPEFFLKYEQNFNLKFENILNQEEHFNQTGQTVEEEAKKESNYQFELDYVKFYSWIYHNMSAMQNDDKDLCSNMKILKYKAENRLKKKVELKELYSLTTNLKKYTLYSFKIKKKEGSLKNLLIFTNILFSDKLDENQEKILPGETEFKEDSYNTLNFDNKSYLQSSLSIRNFSSSKTSLKSLKMQKFEKQMNPKWEIKNLSLYTILFLIFIIIYNIIFMIIIFRNNKNLTDSHTVKSQFNNLKTNFYHTYTSVLNNLFIYDEDKKEVIELFKSYYEELNTNSPEKFSLVDIVNDEIKIKIEILQDQIVKLQEVYYQSYYKKELNTIFQTEMEYYSIFNNEGDYKLNKKNFLVFDAIKTFINLASIISKSEERFLFVYIVDFRNGEYDFSNLKGKDLNNFQIYAIEMVINFINYFKTLENIRNQMDNFYSSQLNYSFNFTMNYTISYQSIHIILIIICIIQLKSLGYIIEAFTLFISYEMKDYKLKWLKEKIQILKNLNNLYSENPRNSLKRLKLMKMEIIEKRNELASKSKNKVKEKVLKVDKNVIIDKKAIVSPLKISTVVIFTIFYAYSIIFLIINSQIRKDLEMDFQISMWKTRNMDDIINNLNILHINIFTNNSDETIFKIITNNGQEQTVYGSFLQDYYIRSKFDAINKLYLNMETLTSKHKKFSILNEEERKLSDCNLIYKEMNDVLLSRLYEKYNHDNLIAYFSNICLNEKVFVDGSSYLIDEINFKLHIYLIDIEDENFYLPKVVEIHNKRTLTKLYFDVNMMFRPIQDYIINKLIFRIFNDQRDFYLMITTIIMIVNIFVDLILLFFVMKMVIQRSNHVRKYLMNFLDILIDS